MPKRVDRLLAEVKQFVNFFTGLWGILAGVSVLFPLSAALFGVLWTPSEGRGLFSTLATIGSLAVITTIFTTRDTLTKIYFSGDLVLGRLQRLLYALKILVTRGLAYCLIGLTLSIFYYAYTPEYKAGNSRDFMALALYVLIFMFLSAGFTLFATKEYIRQGGVVGPEAPTRMGPFLHSAKPDVASFVHAVFEPRVRQRFYSEFVQTLEQQIRRYEGLTLVENTLTDSLVIENGGADKYKYHLFADKVVIDLLNEAGIPVAPFTLHYLRVDGTDVPPVEPVERSGFPTWVYEFDIASGREVTIEASHSYLALPRDVYLLNLQRFTRRLVFEIKKNKDFRYDVLQIGGVIPLTQPAPKRGAYKDTMRYEISELILPGRGFLVQWSPKGLDITS